MELTWRNIDRAFRGSIAAASELVIAISDNKFGMKSSAEAVLDKVKFVISA